MHKIKEMELRLSKAERLEAICNTMYEGNMSLMGRAFGVSPQTVRSWILRGTLNAFEIYAQLPQLNPEWLLTGEGAMLKEEGDATN